MEVGREGERVVRVEVEIVGEMLKMMAIVNPKCVGCR